MTAYEKEKYIKLLKERGGRLDNAIVFYLTNKNPDFKRKKQFVEKLLDEYANIYSVSCGGYKEWVHIDIPQEVLFKLTTSYDEDNLTEQKKINDQNEKDLITEMNEIF